MKNKILYMLVSIALVLFVSPSISYANAGSQSLRTSPNMTAGSCSVRSGRVCYFTFDTTTPATARNSTTFYVDSKTATACISGDVNAGGTTPATGKVTFHRLVGDPPGTTANSMVPSAAVTSTLDSTASTDCFTMATGWWWIELVTASATSNIGAVSITGTKE